MAGERTDTAQQPPVSGIGRPSGISLEGLHSTVRVPGHNAGFWRHLLAFAGPGILIGVGYMDPGNWSTDLAAGAQFRYGLLWIVALASAMAIVMQVCAARLGVVTGKDLAQACRDYYPAWTRWPMWASCEAAIAATDLAEVLGSAVAISLLFPSIPLLWAVCITALDVLLLLALQRAGMRVIEAVVGVLVATIGICYFIEIFVLPQTKPDFGEMGHALFFPSLGQPKMFYMAIAIIGATVMPHNLFLHSALVQTRRFGNDRRSIRTALRFNAIDSVLALTIAFFVNAAILVLAALVFFGRETVSIGGQSIALSDESDWIPIAYFTLAPLLGVAAASVLFAVALLCSGQSSTITGTLAGQVVMEGFLHWHIKPWQRRLLTRLVALVPAILIIGYRGAASVTSLINLSQAVLALVLPLAMLPLLHFTGSRRIMGTYANGRLLTAAAWVTCLGIILLIIVSLPETLREAWEVVAGR